ncbi:MAG: C40 family peptidase [Streptosporangiaceae bacterium]|nr:C40 family peptidase [Streptosporangiaceae bacterium]MBV9853018.1 C40 family peptidase [Streptosporangiaceae bacterium]
MVPAGMAGIAVLGTLTGVLVAVAGGAPRSAAPHVASPAAAYPGLPRQAAAADDGPVLSYPGSGAPAGFSVLAASLLSATSPKVAPLRRSLQADFLIVSPSSLPRSVLGTVLRQHGVLAAEQIEAVRMAINGKYTAVLGVDPSVFRSFAARPTAKSDALWSGVAGGGIAVSYTMGRLDRLPLGGTVRAAGKRTEQLRVVAFGTMGIGGVDAVVSHAVARSLGMPPGNAIVVSARLADIKPLAGTLARLAPRNASVEPLMTVVEHPGSPGTQASGSNPGTVPGSGTIPAASATSAQLNVMLRAALSRLGLPYVWGGSGPRVFDCSGLVQWSFAQAGITMPRVAADQARTGPAVPAGQLSPGDLLFYHTDPTAPGYISHVAIYLGRGWMEQAPQPGENVEIVPADFGSEFAGAIQVNPRLAASVAAGIA